MPEKSSQPSSINKQKNLMSFGVVISVVLLALVAGFGGAWSYQWVSSRNPFSKLANTQNKNIVISEQNATISIAKKVGPSVVSITTSASGRDVFGRSSQSEGAGTGIIISADGLILTNKHVVNAGTSFSIITSDGKEYTQVKLVAKDPSNDIAFLKVEGGSGFTPAELGDSSTVEVGSFVVAIGNALGQFQNTVTTGVISGKGRPILASEGSGAEQLQNLFQTDAAINPGNSGGPLVNIDGQVIGINTAVAGQGSQNLGFAIPINEAKRDIASVAQNGKITRGFLGVSYVPVTAQLAKANNLSVDYGAYISGNNDSSGVLAGSPAAKAGLKSGDIILQVNSSKITSSTGLSSLVGQYQPGETVTLTIYRDGKEQQLKVQLGDSPQATQ